MPGWLNIQEHFAICKIISFFAFKTMPKGIAHLRDKLFPMIICLTQSIVWIFTSFNYKCLNSNMLY